MKESKPASLLPNVVILTSGLSGSSVLAGLLGKAGYWLGHETKKIGYDTYENSELVDLNRRVLHDSGFFHEDAGDLPPPSIPRIAALAEGGRLEVYRRFLQKCSENAPWVWKDPRLCYTMFFWNRIHDFSSSRFIFATRDSRQAWTGLVLRGRVNMAWEDYLRIERNDEDAAQRFLRKHSIHAHSVAFEDLILQPEEVIEGLNNFLGTSITMADFRNIYRGSLGSLRWSRTDFVRARLKVTIAARVLRRGVTFPQTDSTFMSQSKR